MATECSAKAGIVECDEATLAWIAARRPGPTVADLRARVVTPDSGADYEGGVHVVDLSRIRPMVATPGDPTQGIPSDPTNGAFVDSLKDVRIDIAYGGSCTAGKEGDLDQYAQVMAEAEAAGQRVKDGVSFFIQFGSQSRRAVRARAGLPRGLREDRGPRDPSGVRRLHRLRPRGLGDAKTRSRSSAINRNYQNRSGPGQLYLASPLTVAASAVAGKIVAFESGMFRRV